MGFYARPSWKLVSQILTDLFVVGWATAWYFVADFVRRVVLQLAAPVRATEEVSARMRDQVRSAGVQAGRVPAVGKDLRAPFDGLASQVDIISSNAHQQVEAITRASVMLGVVTFLIPVLLVVVLWLPARLRFFIRNRAARRLIDSAADLDLFALRAMTTQRMDRIARITPDPVGAWRGGHREVIDRLADLELRRCGLSARFAQNRLSSAGDS